MNKLLKLKKHISLEQACQHLTAVLGETVTLIELYQLALDNKITLSVDFKSSFEIAQGYRWQEISKPPIYANKNNYFLVTPWYALYFDNAPMVGVGTWDLSMHGLEFSDVEHLLCKETGGTPWQTPRVPFVVLQKDDLFCKLKVLKTNADIYQHVVTEQSLSETIRKGPYNGSQHCDATSLHNYAHELVIKTEELTRFIQEIDDVETNKAAISKPSTLSKDKPLMPKTKTSYLTLISALLKEHGIDPSQRGVSTSIELMIQQDGKTLSGDTIRHILKEVQELNS